MNKFTYMNKELFRLTQGVQITEDVLYPFHVTELTLGNSVEDTHECIDRESVNQESDTC